MPKREQIAFEREALPISVHPCRQAILITDLNEPPIHEEIEIKYFYEGSATLLIDGETVRAEAGDIIVVNPYQFHATVDTGDVKGRYHLFMIGLDLFAGMESLGLDLRHIAFGEQKSFVNLIKGEAALGALLEEIVEEQASKREAYGAAVIGLCARLFAAFIRDHLRRGYTAKRDVDRYYGVIKPALAMIRDRYDEHFTVDALASACCISKYHFCRIFKCVMGTSAISYINSYRLRIAAALLEGTDRSVGAVASMCGFDDAAYFCRLYKKHFGTTPKGFF